MRRCSSRLLPLLGVLTFSLSAHHLCGCRNEKSKKPSLPEVHSRWRKMIANKECAELFGLLDQKSRWAVISLVRDANEVAKLVEAHYPANRRARALARVSLARSSSGPAEWLAGYCRKRDLLKLLAPLAAQKKSISREKNRAIISIEGGKRLHFFKDPYGRWGCTALKKRLKKEQIRMANVLKATRENARLYQTASSHR